MTTSEEIVVSGEDFIERRIILFPGESDIADIQRAAYGHGYRRGWSYGFVIGTAFVAVLVLLLWFAFGY
jgi:hypothetical protein